MLNGRTLVLCAATLIVACHSDSNEAPVASITPHPKTPRVVKRGPTPDELTVGMVEAATTVKSTVPVVLKFDVPQRPLVGQPLEVGVAVLPQISAKSAVLEAAGSDGLKLAPDSAPIAMPSVEPTEVYRQTIGVVPSAEGVQLLSLRVSLTHDDITETRQFAIPLIVAAAGDAAVADKH